MWITPAEWLHSILHGSTYTHLRVRTLGYVNWMQRSKPKEEEKQGPVGGPKLAATTKEAEKHPPLVSKRNGTGGGGKIHGGSLATCLPARYTQYCTDNNATELSAPTMPHCRLLIDHNRFYALSVGGHVKLMNWFTSLQRPDHALSQT